MMSVGLHSRLIGALKMSRYVKEYKELPIKFFLLIFCTN